MELHENHEGDGGAQFEDADEAREELEAERVEQQVEDPSVLANPTELKEGAVSGGGEGNPTSPAPSGNSGGASDGGSLPGNAGSAGAGQNP